MKNLLLASFLIIPSITFAGGIGGVSLDDYNIVKTAPTETSAILSLSESSEAPRVKKTKTRTTYSRERRRSYGFRLPSRRSLGTTSARQSGGRHSYSQNYWSWVDAQRTATNTTTGVTRTGTTNFGDSYELATGLEPIDPNDNIFRGHSREVERQSAAQLKMLRLRSRR